MYTYEVRFEFSNQTYVDTIEAPSQEAARRLFKAKYPEARILYVTRVG